MAFTTWNPADKHADIILSNGDLTALAGVATGYNNVRSIYSASSGKYYWEITYDIVGINGDTIQVGVATSAAALDADLGGDANAYVYMAGGHKGCAGGGVEGYGNSYTVGDILGIALDLDNGKIWFSKNGIWQNSGNPETGDNPACTGISGMLHAVWCEYRYNGQITANFGASAFSYSVPSGFSSGFGLSVTSDVTIPSIQTQGFTGIYSAPSIPMQQAQGYTGIYSAPLIPMIQPKGYTGIHAEPSIPRPTVIVTGHDNITHAQASVTIPFMVARITQAKQIWGNVSIPSMVAKITERETTLANVSIPMMTAELTSGIHADLEATAPMMIAEGLFSGQAEITIPMMTAEIEGKVGRVISSAVKVPMMTVEATGKTEHLANGDVSIPMIRAKADLMTGKIITGTAEIPMMTVALTSREDIAGDIDVSIPMLVAYGALSPERFEDCVVLRYAEPI